MKILLIALISLVPLFLQAGEPLSLEQLEQIRLLNEATDAINEVEKQFDAMVRRKKIDCAKAIGYAPFCDCILKELPVGLSFSDYISITTRTKEENNFDKLDAELQAAYDKVHPIRDACVEKINRQP